MPKHDRFLNISHLNTLGQYIAVLHNEGVTADAQVPIPMGVLCDLFAEICSLRGLIDLDKLDLNDPEAIEAARRVFSGEIRS